MENVGQITVDDAVVKNNKEPIITYNKDKKITAA